MTSCSAGSRWAATSSSSSCGAGAAGSAHYPHRYPRRSRRDRGPAGAGRGRGDRAGGRRGGGRRGDAPEDAGAATRSARPKSSTASAVSWRPLRSPGWSGPRPMRDRHDSTGLLPTLAGLPTLVIVGEEDTVTPPDAARRMAAAIPGARLVVIPAPAMSHRSSARPRRPPRSASSSGWSGETFCIARALYGRRRDALTLRPR